jgi:hypothetical protein
MVEATLNRLCPLAGPRLKIILREAKNCPQNPLDNLSPLAKIQSNLLASSQMGQRCSSNK